MSDLFFSNLDLIFSHRMTDLVIIHVKNIYDEYSVLFVCLFLIIDLTK